MFYEGSITTTEEELREPLFKALQAKDEAAIESLLNNPVLAAIIAMDHDGETPVLGNAQRLLRTGTQGVPLLKAKTAEAFKPKWEKLVKDLQSLIGQADEETLAQYYRSQPWTFLREEYAKNLVSTLPNPRNQRADVRRTPLEAIDSTPSSLLLTPCSPTEPAMLRICASTIDVRSPHVCTGRSRLCMCIALWSLVSFTCLCIGYINPGHARTPAVASNVDMGIGTPVREKKQRRRSLSDSIVC